MAEARGRAKEDQADVGAAGDVIGDEEHRTLEIGEVFAAHGCAGGASRSVAGQVSA